MTKDNKETNVHGEQYTQFYHKPKEAIKHLKRVKRGECIAALHRTYIGDIDIIWGENDPKTNKGYGLKHIIEKHGKEIKQLGFEVEDFIPIIVQFGEFDVIKSDIKGITLESKAFRVVISIERNKQEETLSLADFDLRK